MLISDMTNEQKLALAKEMLTNMDLTKEQYIQMCELCDELDLYPKTEEPEERELSWDEVFDLVEK